ncbi:MAG: hypothetical protein FJW36_15565 [Acidobacteria bacterium]|nr:hypothetical protein [Acidobacteriota bacterium]
MRDGSQKRLPKQLTADNLVVTDGKGKNCEIQFTATKIFDQYFCHRLNQRYAHFGVALLKGGEGFHHGIRQHGWNHANL